ncbi:uncharacterized protein EV422DRAFT_616986 [Fimicolochytrium jonesii]|uniref:uncharacterized protein n=1 Tax=Fimicolochytrium jonesii TaxID=1396493 RepID=UPI0022FEB3A2|nr:uncharacterized protein EV422DRAFT_616986 [Fimicolochytrium jonesii]KAI8825968.1 hypothetical protein EV422DRAFT_616986 [Fimicolochytrium jonesii]
MDLCIDTAEDAEWREDVALVLATMRLPDEDAANEYLSATLESHYVPEPHDPPLSFLAIVNSLRSILPAHDDASIEPSELFDDFLDEEWDLSGNCVRVDEQGNPVWSSVLLFLEKVATDAHAKAADSAVQQRIREPSYDARALYIMDEPLLPAQTTMTSIVPKFKPLPTVQQLAGRMIRLGIKEKGFEEEGGQLAEAMGRQFNAALSEPFLGRPSSARLLLSIVDPFDTVSDPFAEDRWLGELLTENLSKKMEASEPMEAPIFATRNDPEKLPSPKFTTPLPAESQLMPDCLTEDAPLSALVEGLGAGISFLKGLEEEEDDMAGRVVPDGLLAALSEPLIDAADDATVQATIDHVCTATTDVDIMRRMGTTDEDDVPNPSKKKRRLRRIESPILSFADEPDLCPKRRRQNDSLPELTLDAVVNGQFGGMDYKSLEEPQQSTTDGDDLAEDLSTFFDFAGAASTKPYTPILDSPWDVASTKQLSIPNLPHPPPFHPRPDAWTSFRALVQKTLKLRPFENMTSTELALMHWNPIAAMMRAMGVGDDEAITVGGIGRGVLSGAFGVEDHEGLRRVIVEACEVEELNPGDYMEFESTSVNDGDRPSSPIQAMRTLRALKPPKTAPVGHPPPPNISSARNTPQRTIPVVDLVNPPPNNLRPAHNAQQGAVPVIDLRFDEPGDHMINLGLRRHNVDSPIEIEDEPAFEIHSVEEILPPLPLDNPRSTRENAMDDPAQNLEEVLAKYRKPFSVRSSLDQFLTLRGRPPAVVTGIVERVGAQADKAAENRTPTSEMFPTPTAVKFALPPFDSESATRHTYIAGERILKNKDLVRAFEKTYAVDLIERDLECASEDAAPGARLEADLIIDERTCVIFYPLPHLPLTTTHLPTTPTPHTSPLTALGTLGTTELGSLLLRCILRFTRVHLVLEAGPQTGAYMLTPPVVNALQWVGAFAASCRNWAEVRWVVSLGAEESAWIARNIGDTIAESYDTPPNSSTTPKAWLSRPAYETRTWLSHEESAQERFLRSFPTLNSFSAQIVLTIMTLREFMLMSVEEVVEKVGVWVPERGLRVFWEMVNTQLGIGVE